MKRFFYRSAGRILPVIVYLYAVSISTGLGNAQDALSEGKKFLLNNQPAKAVPLFYKALSDGKADTRTHLYIGVCYIQLGKYADAEQQLLTGKETDTAGSYLYWYNLGNVYFLQSRFTEAEEAYTAALTARRAYPQAVLNRANTRIKLENYAAALEDYTFYLNLEPSTSQKQSIQRMVSLLQAELREEELVRMQTEAQALAEEAERNAAETRYRKLQEEINAHLRSVDSASSLSAGSDETLDYVEDYHLD